MIVLASASAARAAMLRGAGVAFRALPAQVDERALEQGLGDAGPAAVALALARAKALAVPAGDALVLGGDSLVVAGGRRFDKPASRAEAAEHLRAFSGQVMELHAAAALARGGAVMWEGAELARLHVRPLSDRFIDSYLDAEWPEIGACVGAFRIEGRGAQIFRRIEGDHFTVLGMPLLPVLQALRDAGELLQ